MCGYPRPTHSAQSVVSPQRTTTYGSTTQPMEATMEQPHEPTPQELAKLFDGTGEANSPTSNGQPSASEPADDEKPSDEPREDVPEIIVELINHFEGIFVPPGLVV